MAICKENLHKLTPLNLYIAITNLNVYREVRAVSEVKYWWNNTTPTIFSKLIFIIKFIFLLFPLSFILMRSLFSSVITLFKQIRGVITGTHEGIGFPFTPDETYRKAHFIHKNININSNATNISSEDVSPHKEVYATRVKEDLFRASRKRISRSTKMIRKSLLMNDYVLEGVILDTKFPRTKVEELLDIVRGRTSMKAYLIQKVDFGILNKPLKNLFPKLITKKSKSLKGSYLVLKDNDVNKLEDSLREVFMNSNIKIKLIKKEEVRNGRTG